MAFQIAVTQLHVAPSEFWKMKPRHFWALAETLRPAKSGPSIDKDERKAIADMLKGTSEWW
jgi:hypothetical protein